MSHKLKSTSIALIVSFTAQGCATTQGGGSIGDSISKTLHETFNNDDPCANSKRNIGIAVGAIAGAVIGSQVSGKNNRMTGAVVGAAAGGGLGALVGHELDYRTCEISRIQKKYNADIQIVPLALESIPSESSNGQASEVAAKTQEAQKSQKNEPVGLSVSVVDSAQRPQFASGSADIQPEAKAMFSEIAQTYVHDQGDKDSGRLAKNRRVLLIGHTDDTGNSKLNAELVSATLFL